MLAFKRTPLRKQNGESQKVRKYSKHIYLTKDLFLEYIKNYYNSTEDKQLNFLINLFI